MIWRTATLNDPGSQRAARVSPSGPAARTERGPMPRSPREPAMTDVARLAGVSHQTVSRVLNGHPNVTAQTRLRVHAGATEVGAQITRGGVQRSTGDALARITTDAPIVLRGGDRFVLRLPAPLRTIGGGVVVDPYARRRRLPGSWGDRLGLLGTDPKTRHSSRSA